MKRSISDLMDHICVSDVEIEQNTPLSSQRIKELTMDKIKEKAPKRQLKLRILLVAAIIAMLTMTTFAAEEFEAGDWFRDILKSRGTNETEIEEQVAFIDEIGLVYQQSMTSEGTTITPIAGYGDENVFYLRLKVEGAEGTVLPDGERYCFYGSWEQRDAVLEYPDELEHGLWVLPDAEPEDNVKEFLAEITVIPGTTRKLNDGSPLLYHIYGLFQRIPVENDVDAFQQILPGDFVLDLSYFNQVDMTELDVEGLSYHREETGTLINLEGEEHEIPYAYTVTLSDLKISPLSICYHCSYEMSDPEWKVGVDFQVVMKDGTEAKMTYRRGSGYEEAHPWAASRNVAIFDVPIDLAQVDYILIGGEYKVYIPETDE